MVTSLARQSVIIKCNMEKSVMTGNYEYYYAAGLFFGLCDAEVPENILPAALAELIHDNAEAAEVKDKREAYLKKMLLEHEPDQTYDEQMKELLLWGRGESRMWEI